MSLEEQKCQGSQDVLYKVYIYLARAATCRESTNMNSKSRKVNITNCSNLYQCTIFSTLHSPPLLIFSTTTNNTQLPTQSYFWNISLYSYVHKLPTQWFECCANHLIFNRHITYSMQDVNPPCECKQKANHYFI